MKKFLAIAAIALGGVGLALGVSALFFSPASEKTEVETGGLIDDLGTAAPDETAKPKKSPKATDEPSSGGDSGTSSAAASGGSGDASAADEPSGPSSKFVQSGVVVEASDHEDDPCADEDNEAERDACEDELEAEAEEEEEEAEQDAEEEEDDEDE